MPSEEVSRVKIDILTKDEILLHNQQHGTLRWVPVESAQLVPSEEVHHSLADGGYVGCSQLHPEVIIAIRRLGEVIAYVCRFCREGWTPGDPCNTGWMCPTCQATYKKGSRAMRVLVCGSRTFNGSRRIGIELSKLPPNTVIIHGGCSGADSIAGAWAHQLGLEAIVFHPGWAQYGGKAGPKRNRRMLEEGRPDLVLAFLEGTTKTPGTAHMIDLAVQAGVKVTVFAGQPEANKGGRP